MKITDAEYVLRLWASAVRPSVRRAAPAKLERRGEGDDRRLQARVKVEICPGYHKAKPVLWIAYVNEAQTTQRDELVIAHFKAELGSLLTDSPIIIEDDDQCSNDFEVTVNAALSMLAGCGTPIARRTLMYWISQKIIFSREQGQRRFVKWSEVVARAPRRRDPKKSVMVAA